MIKLGVCLTSNFVRQIFYCLAEKGIRRIRIAKSRQNGTKLFMPRIITVEIAHKPTAVKGGQSSAIFDLLAYWSKIVDKIEAID